MLPRCPAFFFSCRRRHTRSLRDWSSDVCSSDLFAEQGFPGFEMPVWGGAYLPAGTPKPIVQRLSREIVAVLHDPGVSERLTAMGQVPIGNTPEEFAENYRRDFPRWVALIKASGAKVE